MLARTRAGTRSNLVVVRGRSAVRRPGRGIRIIAEALGHESLESTKIYTQVSFQRTRRIAELFGSPRSYIIRCKSASRSRYFTRA